MTTSEALPRPATNEPTGTTVAVRDQIEKAVLMMLTGTPARKAASQARITPASLAATARAYQQAGRAAVAAQTAVGHWGQATVEFTSWDTAERTTATVLAPRLQHAQVTDGWWFLRKYPCWRIRFQPTPGTTPAAASQAVSIILDELTASGLVRRWQTAIYEPETLAFGGSVGLTVAHQMFCSDTLGILARARQPQPQGSTQGGHPGRKEQSVLLCAALLRAASLDWFEQGDTWHLVSHLRPLPPGATTQQHHRAMTALLNADTAPDGPLLAPGGPLAGTAAWIGGFRHAGQALGAAARDGELQRGLRDILAHMIIFHWNRLGLSVTAQAILARAAQDVIMNTTGLPAGNR